MATVRGVEIAVTLEPLRPEHAVEMVEVLSSPSLYRFTGGGPPALDELTSRYERQVAGPADVDVAWCNWVVRADGALVGYVQATVALGAQGPVAELAWVVRSEASGRGIATRAAQAALALLREQWQVVAVQAHIADDHLASQAVARHLGLEPTAHLHDGERRWSAALMPQD